jgi:hypothetical protein
MKPKEETDLKEEEEEATKAEAIETQIKEIGEKEEKEEIERKEEKEEKEAKEEKEEIEGKEWREEDMTGVVTEMIEIVLKEGIVRTGEADKTEENVMKLEGKTVPEDKKEKDVKEEKETMRIKEWQDMVMTEMREESTKMVRAILI